MIVLPKRKITAYVAGPFLGRDESGTPLASHWLIHQNINRAARVALEVWRLGAVALCPHMNTAFFQEELPNDVWYEGDIELLLRCDALVTVEGWERSHGTLKEIAVAKEKGIPVFYTIPDFAEWLKWTQEGDGYNEIIRQRSLRVVDLIRDAEAYA